ncbi:CHASE3 domain-containing protein [Pseudomonas sp. Marseille-Q5115]|uniref:CHASE3 domain-containing protein n=1 Tax=Pseudomonas sp. Marseille-Q5115 TaxID=2866593 RepID=UPI001CE450CD|nr:CHASE3 domain-containing protein [Pseudomonas sp. Marseille-Q5115]
MPYRTPRLLIAATAATVVMTITAAVGPFTLFWTNQTRTERNQVEQQLDSIRAVQGLLVDAETGERGYALTGKDVFLQPYYVARSQLPSALQTLRISYEEDLPEEITKVKDFIEHTDLVIGHLDMVVKLRSEGGLEAAAAEVASGNGKHLMDYVRDVSSEVIRGEVQEVAALDEKLNTNLLWAVAISAASFVLTLMLGRFMYVSMRRTIRRQGESARTAVLASTQLGQSLEHLERRNNEVGLLAEMARLLQTDLSQEETLQLASTYCQQLLKGTSGTLFLYRNSADALQPSAGWGHEDVTHEAPIAPKDCWAIRRGHPHVAQHSHELRCAHYAADDESDEAVHWCLPLMAYG